VARSRQVAEPGEAMLVWSNKEEKEIKGRKKKTQSLTWFST